MSFNSFKTKADSYIEDEKILVSSLQNDVLELKAQIETLKG